MNYFCNLCVHLRLFQNKMLKKKALDLFGFGHGFCNDAGSSWVICYWDKWPRRSWGSRWGHCRGGHSILRRDDLKWRRKGETWQHGTLPIQLQKPYPLGHLEYTRFYRGNKALTQQATTSSGLWDSPAKSTIFIFPGEPINSHNRSHENN